MPAAIPSAICAACRLPPGGRAASVPDQTRGTVVLALAANIGVAVIKLAAGLLTGSAAMLSEAAHSVADTMNEVFLLVSLRRSERPAGRTHPLDAAKTLDDVDQLNGPRRRRRTPVAA
jgi:Co/Zn/Cd efflux system component